MQHAEARNRTHGSVNGSYSSDDQAECRIVMIDGVPYLRLGAACGLLSRLSGERESSDSRVRLDATANRIYVDGRGLDLTRNEFRLMTRLVEAQGDLCSYEQLTAAIWGDKELEAGKVSLRNHVSMLRSKLRAARLPDQLLMSVHGKGLRLDLKISNPTFRQE